MIIRDDAFTSRLAHGALSDGDRRMNHATLSIDSSNIRLDEFDNNRLNEFDLPSIKYLIND